jgi:hypothetical protein
MNKYLLLSFFIILPAISHADSYMEEYKKKNLRRDQIYKSGYEDLRPQIQDEMTVNPIEEEKPPVVQQELPQMPVQGSPEGLGMPQIPPGMAMPPSMPGSPNMSFEEAKEMGRKLLEAQESQKQTK